MTRDEAIEALTEAGKAPDDAFPLLEAAIACAIHDYPHRETAPLAGRWSVVTAYRSGIPSPSGPSPPPPPNGWPNGSAAKGPMTPWPRPWLRTCG